MIVLSEGHRDEIAAHGERDYPHECCGLLLGNFADDGGKVISEVYLISNAREEQAKRNRFLIRPEELMRGERYAQAKGLEVVGFYHSHPDHPAQWSSTDLAEAHWFGCSYVITSVEKGKAVLTNSFELTGMDENDKKLVGEKIEVA